MPLKWPHEILIEDKGTLFSDDQGMLTDRSPAYRLQCAAILRSSEIKINEITQGDVRFNALPDSDLLWNFETTQSSYDMMIEEFVNIREFHINNRQWSVTSSFSPQKKEYASRRPNYRALVVVGDYNSPRNPFKGYDEPLVNNWNKTTKEGFAIQTIRSLPNKVVLEATLTVTGT